jgi:uncharacterized transporter YbjL
MIIMSASTPTAIIDLSNNNQSQQQQVQSAEQSKKATDTVQVSAQAREMAGTELNNRPVASNAPIAIQKAADNEVAERVADNEVIEQQRPSNPVTHKPETTKIDIVA